MDFAELSYWLDAMTEYERARVDGGGGDIMSSKWSDYSSRRQVTNQAKR